MSNLDEGQLNIGECRFYCRRGTNDSSVVRSVFFGEYTLPDVSQYVDGSTSIDVGAHIGAYTVWACANHTLLNVVAVEPLPENVEQWRKNQERNALHLKTRILAKAAGVAGQVVKIGYGDPNSESGKIHQFIGNIDATLARQVEVPTIDLAGILDSAKEAFGTAKVWTLKLDCEGGEVPLLEGAKAEELDRCKWIIGEHHGQGERVRKAILRANFVERATAWIHDLFCFENRRDFRKMEL